MKVQTALSSPYLPANLASDDKAKKIIFLLKYQTGFIFKIQGSDKTVTYTLKKEGGLTVNNGILTFHFDDEHVSTDDTDPITWDQLYNLTLNQHCFQDERAFQKAITFLQTLSPFQLTTLWSDSQHPTHVSHKHQLCAPIACHSFESLKITLEESVWKFVVLERPNELVPFKLKKITGRYNSLYNRCILIATFTDGTSYPFRKLPQVLQDYIPNRDNPITYEQVFDQTGRLVFKTQQEFDDAITILETSILSIAPHNIAKIYATILQQS